MEARSYLEEKRNIITAKYRILVEASLNEHLKAIFADELGLTEEERSKLVVSRPEAIKAGLNAAVIRAAGLLDEPSALPPSPKILRPNVLAILQDPVVAKHALAAANEAAARGILLAPKEAPSTDGVASRHPTRHRQERMKRGRRSWKVIAPS
jgi:hypothetical protein